MEKTICLNDKNFEKEISNCDLPIIVDFGATWCMPCKTIDKYMEEIANEFLGKVKTFTFLVDNDPEIPSKYGVRSNPTIIFFKNGKVLNQLIGAVPKKKIVDFLKEIL